MKIPSPSTHCNISRHERRARIARFRHASKLLEPSLVGADESLDGHPHGKACRAICSGCFETATPAELDAAATRMLRKLIPDGRFLDGANIETPPRAFENQGGSDP